MWVHESKFGGRIAAQRPMRCILCGCMNQKDGTEAGSQFPLQKNAGKAHSVRGGMKGAKPKDDKRILFYTTNRCDMYRAIV